MSSVNRQRNQSGQRGRQTTASSRSAWTASQVQANRSSNSEVDTSSESVDVEITSQWPTAYTDPLTVTYDSGVYHVKTGYFPQTPGTYHGTFTVSIPLAPAITVPIAAGSIDNDDVIEFDFRAIRGAQYYIINMSCTDNYYETTKSGEARVYPVADEEYIE